VSPEIFTIERSTASIDRQTLARRWVVHECGRHFHVVSCMRPPLAELVDVDSGTQRPALAAIRILMSTRSSRQNSLVIFSNGAGPHVSTRVRSPAVHASQIQVAVRRVLWSEW